MPKCYWDHDAKSEPRYPCFDGDNSVCPRCCVEECPRETPELFHQCTLAGHPTWPSVRAGVPRKLVCFEAVWDDTMFNSLSMRGFLEAMAQLFSPPLRVSHRYIESPEHLAYYTSHRHDGLLWSDPDTFDTPVYYLAFHGRPGQVSTALGRIDIQSLCSAFDGFGAYKCLLYFGACSVFDGERGRELRRQLLEASGCEAILGYTTEIDWMDSLVIDMMFLHRFFAHEAPWTALNEIVESIYRDFPRAHDMGYGLVTRE